MARLEGIRRFPVKGLSSEDRLPPFFRPFLRPGCWLVSIKRRSRNRAGLSSGTVSNVERGRDTKAETLKLIRRALVKEGDDDEKKANDKTVFR